MMEVDLKHDSLSKLDFKISVMSAEYYPSFKYSLKLVEE